MGVSVFSCQSWNSWIYEGWKTAKVYAKSVFINQQRKLEDQGQSDTVLVQLQTMLTRD